ncbi:MAG TPA: ABC transporter ATP-binding protein [Nitrososphaerales archaeon]|nr:ABC transporter ATP-binding protein [Nitrososphaerales archaeon]
MATPLLSVQNLSIAYRIREKYYEAVRDVSFDLDEGESVALVGESGSGKSTIGLSILGLLPKNARITSGRILFGGKSLGDLSREEMRTLRWKQISMIFQGSMNSLDPIFKVGDQMVELLRFHKGMSKQEAKTISAEFIQSVGLKPSALDLYPHELSGGMKQRVVIALALLLNSNLLIADEPTTALDVTTQAEIVALMLRLKASHNMSMIFITHDLSLVPNLCSKVVVLYGGASMERGPISEVFSKPMNPYTKALINSVLTLERKDTMPIPGDPPTLRSMPNGCPFSPRCASAFLECESVFPEEYNVSNAKVRCLLYRTKKQEQQELERA